MHDPAPGDIRVTGHFTADSEMFDMNSNVGGRGQVGNASVQAFGAAAELVTGGNAQPFVQDYYGTIHYEFRSQ